MNQYMLILHDRIETFADMAPAEMQKVIERYSVWAGSLAAQGALAGGNKLSDEGGRHVRRENGQVTAVDGPYAEAKEVVGGYFMVNAADYAAAVALVRDCPHLDYGGWIEVRQVEAT